MRCWYLDTSAATKLLVTEAESDALTALLDEESADLAACYLLETELRRLAPRLERLTQESISALLERVDLYDVPPSLYREAGLLPGPQMRSLDALHLAAAIRLGAEAILTYDVRMSEAARGMGLAVVAPTP